MPSFDIRAAMMPSAAERYRAKAEEALQAATDTTDNVTASLLRMLADDYMQLAEEATKTVVQQQQQVQPKDQEPDK